MTPQFIQGFAVETLKVLMLVSMPLLLVALLIGLTTSIIQATTQINEATLAYIPKMVGIYVALIVFSGYMLDRLMTFSSGIFSDFSRFAR